MSSNSCPIPSRRHQSIEELQHSIQVVENKISKNDIEMDAIEEQRHTLDQRTSICYAKSGELRAEMEYLKKALARHELEEAMTRVAELENELKDVIAQSAGLRAELHSSNEELHSTKDELRTTKHNFRVTEEMLQLTQDKFRRNVEMASELSKLATSLFHEFRHSGDSLRLDLKPSTTGSTEEHHESIKPPNRPLAASSKQLTVMSSSLAQPASQEVTVSSVCNDSTLNSAGVTVGTSPSHILENSPSNAANQILGLTTPDPSDPISSKTTAEVRQKSISALRERLWRYKWDNQRREYYRLPWTGLPEKPTATSRCSECGSTNVEDGEGG
ncbi:MAG: hypothetical protein L6R41_004417 [Letrouitia leprolyta]|nr:MAG: hypothetical protein L6R41_004417 [Letrouitia leprolyta]